MNKFLIHLFTIITLVPVLACQKNKIKTNAVDNNSYINNFELIQKSPNNNNLIRITSPQAIIDPTNNDIEITDTIIEILKTNGEDIKIKSGKSRINNNANLIRVYKNVKISLINNKDSYIITDSFDWDLSKSNIELNKPLQINFDNTNIISYNGLYNINSGELKINNNIFNRNIFNKEGEKIYQIKIIADFAKWIKKESSFEFTSNEKQVETTINFLSPQQIK